MGLSIKKMIGGRDQGGYIEKVAGVEAANLIGYWPLNELSGAVANDQSGNERDGSYTGVTLAQTGIGDGNTCPLFDGANDYVDVGSASFISAFSGVAGTILAWIKVSDAGVWTDSNQRTVIYWMASTANRVKIERSTANNTMSVIYRANSATKQINISTSSTDWIHIGLTWDKNAGATGEVKVYYNGSQYGSTLENLGVFVGSLDIDRILVGASIKTPNAVWDGYIAHVAAWTKALTAAQILNLASV
jgi:hypothetical protein